ncbi:MAG: hypothetical protein KME64_32825 [Scytonematopsis contorta HA4267-MV1]|nr:hypothetical protein [Scytonematopsis contorta HA4267-MV1]
MGKTIRNKPRGHAARIRKRTLTRTRSGAERLRNSQLGIKFHLVVDIR